MVILRVWTKENLQMLLRAMKDNIPEQNTMNTYLKAQKTLDWNKVAFCPFSPEECRQKWEDILRKMRKLRTLTELIDEAEDVITNHSKNTKIHPEKPKRPPGPFAIYLEENMASFRKMHPDVNNREVFKLLNQEYRVLPHKKKAKYVGKFQLASEKYHENMTEFSKRYQKGVQTSNYLKSQRSKRAAGNNSATQKMQQVEDTGSSGLPSRPPISGYNLFCKEQLETMEGVPVSQYVKVWAQCWRKLNESQKEKYRTRCQKLKADYAAKLDGYLGTFSEEEQNEALNELGIKRSQLSKILTVEEQDSNPSKSPDLCVQKKTNTPQKRQRTKRTSKSPGLCVEEKPDTPQESQRPMRTSDSEDEDIEDSSSSNYDDDLEF